MKKTLFFLIIVFLNFYYSYSQTQSNVSTPKGNNVTAYITPEDLPGIRAYYDWWYGTQLYPQNNMNTTYDNYSSTGRFNCHGYAWNKSLSNPRWIGYYYSTDEDIYMSDGSYVQVLNEMYPGMVSWGSGDHTAMTTSTQGVWISKWNRYPLFQHAWNNTPYGTSNLKYYVATSITGLTSVLCNSSSRDFTTMSIPNATYSWDIGSGLTKSENGNTCTIYSNGYYNGLTWIEVTITSPIGGGQNDVKTSPKLYFWIGTPAPWITGPSSGEVGNSYQFNVYTDLVQGVDSNVDWGLSPSYDGNTIYDYEYWASAGFYSQEEGTFQISASVQNTCGTEYATHYIDIYNYGDFLLSPNPASNEVTITVNNHNQNIDLSSGIHEVSIYNMYGNLKSKHKYSGESFTIPLSKIEDGSYIIRIDNGKSIVNKQLIVKH